MTDSTRVCSIHGCERHVVARGWCSTHWQRWQRNGDPLVTRPNYAQPAIDPWTRIDSSGGPDACWPWTHSFDPDGYGRQKIAGTTWIVPRWVLTQTVGPLQHDEVTRHTCDNRACCNPAHLLRGTPGDNVQDMITRSRHIHGQAHWTKKDPSKVQGTSNGESKLSDDDVAEVRRLYSTERWTQKSLGEHFGVSQSAISRITRGKGWKHLLAA